MEKQKKERLEAAGWKVGSTEEFLGLSAEESAYIDLRLKLSDAVRERRKKKGLTQLQLAELLRSSQSRVAKVEAADETVSLDLLVRTLLALRSLRREVPAVSPRLIVGRSSSPGRTPPCTESVLSCCREERP